MSRVQQKQIPLSEAQLALAQKLKATGRVKDGGPLSWHEVAKRMGMGVYRLWAVFDPERLAKDRAHRREWVKGYRLDKYKSAHSGISKIPYIAVPPHVIEDRNRRINADRGVNQLILGDPVFEQSALYKKRLG